VQDIPALAQTFQTKLQAASDHLQLTPVFVAP
jgi:hypothetical protein